MLFSVIGAGEDIIDDSLVEDIWNSVCLSIHPLTDRYDD
jgi:hypothetical protein